MIRGTTPTLQFEIPIDMELVDVLNVAFSQRGKMVLCKTVSDCQIDGNIARCRLSQQDTLALDHSCCVEIQVRIKTISGDALASQVLSTGVDRILQDGEI